MSGLEPVGKLLMIVGASLILLGGLVWLLSRADFVGRLPGDIRIQMPGFTCLVPLTSSILFSIVLTIVLNVILRLINR